MDTLTDLYNQQLVPLDQELEKQASAMVKQAEEEEFAGRIMARGFAAELNKLAAPDPYKLKYDAKARGSMSSAMMGGSRTSKAPGGGAAAPAARPAAKAGPSVPSPFNSPKPAGGSVTGKLSPGKMPSLPGQGKPTQLAGTK